ncbi:MAG: hypothetical protein J0H43_14370 [Actinobacteria bacterium]|nr:hypothetical protein [Actinomycetota bacterium]
MTDDHKMSKCRAPQPVLVIRSIEGRRASAEHPIAPEDYERQLRNLESGGLRLPRTRQA